ncbi:MAG: CPBP family intramembrane metalloprotease [Planctomycetaceae bacterium]|nr:CPBP family intramembrane metalloprotease [Planctomycetaceae bacterium]
MNEAITHTPSADITAIDDDFPFYNGKPASISGPQWLFLMAMVVVGFLLIATPIPLFRDPWLQFIPAILFFTIPLGALAKIVPGHWRAIFRQVGVRDILWALAFGMLNLMVTFVVGILVSTAFGAVPNSAVSGLTEKSTVDRVLFFLKTLPQLFGEEVMTILPYLALMFYFTSKTGNSRMNSIVLAWLLSSLIFGLAHLHSYRWNLVQCVLVIGTARLVLSLAYIQTKNIWVSTGAHIINDWAIFALSIFGSE